VGVEGCSFGWVWGLKELIRAYQMDLLCHMRWWDIEMIMRMAVWISQQVVWQCRSLDATFNTRVFQKYIQVSMYCESVEVWHEKNELWILIETWWLYGNAWELILCGYLKL